MSSPQHENNQSGPSNGPAHQSQHAQGGETGDVESALQGLVEIKDQHDLERDVSTEVKAATIEEETKKDETRIANLQTKIKSIQESKEKLVAEKTAKQNARAPPRQIDAISSKMLALDNSVSDLLEEIAAFQDRIEERKQAAVADAQAQDEHRLQQTTENRNQHHGPTQQDGEDRRAFLIRTGKITPFAIAGESEDSSDHENDVLTLRRPIDEGDHPASHRILQRPGFGSQLHREPIPVEDVSTDPLASNLESEFGLRPRKRARTQADRDAQSSSEEGVSRRVKRRTHKRPDDDAEYSAAESVSSQEQAPAVVHLNVVDDASEQTYKARISTWVEERSKLRQELEGIPPDSAENDEEEWFKPTPGKPDKAIIDGYRLPQEVADFLFPFQRVGIQWLSELHRRKEGGILCDEMGLGKTVQIIAMIAALHYSRKLDGPVLIVSPTTLMPQWIKHFHTWWPPLRVSILHSTGSGMINPELEDSAVFSRDKSIKKSSAAQKIINGVVNNGNVLITTYRGLHTYIEELNTVAWGYAVLDEGHLIRNRETDAAKACKQLYTFHRIVLSGTPVQNNLRELFSLFEFVYPGLLGSELGDFTRHFEQPIREGHHRGASSLAIATADRTSKTLRDCVKPYMLRRVKADVADSLPPKSEQVFFCKLTPTQEAIYQTALSSPEVQRIFDWSSSRQTEVFSAIDKLRKICCHPDLCNKEKKTLLPDWGNPERSVKMQVLVNLLRISKKFGHKTLVFSQRLDILDMVERFLRSEKIAFARLDGKTAQVNRQPLVDKFNKSPDLDVFLLTPQTGGLGLNLTGADRVILFDPSWNPATDRQAIERAWRLGQMKPVKIYRLLTTGTIEEKIYRKQLYKQFVSDRVMTDTDFNRFTDTTNLHDLFTYGTEQPGEENMFDGVEPGSGRQEDSANQSAGDTNGAQDPEASNINSIDRLGGVEQFKEDASDEKDMLDAVCNTSVENAYEHDSIVSAKKVKADRVMTEHEADRLNEKTVKFLREQAAKAYFDRNQNRPKRKETTDSSSLRKRVWSLATVKPLVVRYLKRAGGKARSAALVEYFNREYSSIPPDMFKQALKQVASMQEMARRGGSIWHLKNDMRAGQ